MNLSLQILSDLAAFIAVASLKATVLVVLVLAIQRLAGKYLSASLRYLLWLSVVISLVTPVGFDTALPTTLLPATSATLSHRRDADSNAAAAGTAASALGSFDLPAQPTVSQPVQSVRAVPLEMTDPPFPWMQVLPYLWLAGVLGVLGAIAVSTWRFARLLRRASAAPVAVQDVLLDCMRQTACSSKVRVLHSPDIEVPMIAGQFRPVLLLPQGLEQAVSREQLRHIFIHELMHLQRGDIASNWIVALVQALHWFNPVVWFAFFCMRQDRELACDAATLRHLAPADRAAYGRTLLRLNDTLRQSSTPMLALGMVDASSQLEKRILMLVQSSRSRKLQSRAATLLFIPLAAVAFSQPALRETERAVEALESVAGPVAPAIAEPVVANALAAPVAGTAAARPAPLAEPVPVVVPVAEEAAPPAAPETPALEEPVRNLAAVSPDAVLLATLSENPLRLPLAAAAAVSAAPAPAAEPDPGLATAILQLADEISAAAPDGIRFVEELDAAAAECTARGKGIFAALSAPCAKTRRALHRGHLLYFGYQCFLLGNRQEELVRRYQEATAGQPGASSLDSTLRASAENLASFCSKETYAQQYPAFAALFADAESLEYFDPAERTLASTLVLANRSLRNAGAWTNSSWYYEIGQGQGGGMDAASGAYGGPAPAAPAGDSAPAAPAPQ